MFRGWNRRGRPSRPCCRPATRGRAGSRRPTPATRGFDEFLGRWLPRARRWPSELFAEPRDDAPGAGQGSAAAVAVASRATRAGRLARLAELLHGITRDGGATAVSVETAPDAVAEVQTALSTAGFDVAEAGAGAPVHVGAWGQVDPAPHAVAFELPPSPAPLARAAGTADRFYAIVDALHERQFELTAARAGLPVAPLGEPGRPCAAGRHRGLPGPRLRRPRTGRHGERCPPARAAHRGTRRRARRRRPLRPAPGG